MNDALFYDCATIIGDENVDATQDPPVFLPPGIQHLCALVKRCSEAKQGIRIAGAGTHPLNTAQSSGCALTVSLRALDAVVEVNVDDQLLVAQAGVRVDDLIALAERFHLFLPIDITSGKNATIGGAYMTGAFVSPPSGYGSLARAVTGVRAVAATGEIVTFGGRTVKNVTGFEVTRFLYGTMGMFAAAVELTLKALPLPEYRATAVVSATLSSADMWDRFIRDIESVSSGATRAEFIAPEGLGGRCEFGIRFDGFKEIVDGSIRRIGDMSGGAVTVDAGSVRAGEFENRRRALARTLADAGLLTITLPPAATPAFIEGMYGLAPEAPLSGHLQHGRFHIAVTDNELQSRIGHLVRALGGGEPLGWYEFASGNLSQLFTPQERSLALALKRELDPGSLFNPHLVL